MYRHAQPQIGTLEIKRHHPPIPVETLKNGSEGLHVELRNTKTYVESTEVENGAEATGALGGQKIGEQIPPPLVSWHLDTFHGPLGEEGWNLIPQGLPFELQLGQCGLDRG